MTLLSSSIIGRRPYRRIAAALLCGVAGGCARDHAGARRAPPDGAAAAAASSPVAPGPRAAGSSVGLAYETLPSDVTLQAGAAIAPAPGAPHGAHFDFAQVSTPLGARIWLESAGPRLPDGRVSHLVVAELEVPPLTSDEHVALASCDAGGRLDPRIVAIVIAPPGTPPRVQVRQAWRANLAERRFDLVALEGITCEEPDP